MQRMPWQLRMSYQLLKFMFLLAILLAFLSTWEAFLAIVAAILACFPWYRNWLKNQPGYTQYLSRLPGWTITTWYKLSIVTILYSLPLSILGIWTMELISKDSPPITLLSLSHASLGEFIGTIPWSVVCIVFLFTWFTGKWGYQDKTLKPTSQGLPRTPRLRKWLEKLDLSVESHISREAKQKAYRFLGIQRIPKKEALLWVGYSAWCRLTWLRLFSFCAFLLLGYVAVFFYGLPLALLGAVLAWDKGYRDWLMAKPGYIYRLSKLPGWRRPGPLQLSLVSLAYLSPLSLYFWVGLVQTWYAGRLDTTPSVLTTSLAWAVSGLVFAILTLLWLLWNWHLYTPEAGYREYLSRKRRKFRGLCKRFLQESEQHQYNHAFETAKQAYDFVNLAFGENSAHFAISLNNLALAERNRGNYAEAKDLFEKARDVMVHTIGKRHPHYATCLSNLGDLYRIWGNYAQAEHCFVEALEIERWILGANHKERTLPLKHLATLYMDRGDYEAAEPFLMAALAICRRTLGEDAPLYVSLMSNFAELQSMKGDYETAESLTRQALDTLQRTAKGRRVDNAAHLNRLATLSLYKGKYAEAESLYNQAIEVKRSVRGENHPDYAVGLNNLAVLFITCGDYNRAEPLLREALRIYHNTPNENRSLISETLQNLAQVYVATDHISEAFTLIGQVIAIDEQMIEQIFSLSSDRQRMKYARITKKNLEMFLSLIFQYQVCSSEAVKAAFDVVLRRKAIVAEAAAEQRRAIFTSHHPELEVKFHKLNALRSQIAEKMMDGPGTEGTIIYRRILNELNTQKEPLERELAEKIAWMNMAGTSDRVSRQAIAAKLPKDTALVEFIHIDVFDFLAVPAKGEPAWKQAHYLAFVLASGEPESVQMIDLGEASVIDQQIVDFRRSITSEKNGRPNRHIKRVEELKNWSTSVDNGLLLRKNIFDPVILALDNRKDAILAEENDEELVKLSLQTHGRTRCDSLTFSPKDSGLNHRHLFLVPDGDLTQVPFETLPIDNVSCLIDYYCISYLSAGRDLLYLAMPSTTQPGCAFIAANPDFDLGEVGQIRKTTKQVGDARLTRKLFNPLLGTNDEGKEIAKQLGVQPLLHDAVLKGDIRNCRSPYIFHLATHGVFLYDQQSLSEDGRLKQLAARGRENPLLRSCLALAGANTWDQQGKLPLEAENGILTAEDVTGLDLLGTQLVVLSACDTGLGEVQAGEGVLGLRRAFVLAGARTLVMSLWKVPDEETKQLMIGFYQRLIGEGQSRAEALRNAQLALKAIKPHPFYWGAFICQGDPEKIPSFYMNRCHHCSTMHFHKKKTKKCRLATHGLDNETGEGGTGEGYS